MARQRHFGSHLRLSVKEGRAVHVSTQTEMYLQYLAWSHLMGQAAQSGSGIPPAVRAGEVTYQKLEPVHSADTTLYSLKEIPLFEKQLEKQEQNQELR